MLLTVGLPRFPVIFTAGDLRPDLVGTLPYDLTGHTIELDIKRPDGTVLTKTAEIVDPFDDDDDVGTFRFVWEADDLQVGGNQVCQLRDIDSSARPLSSPKFMIDVIDREQTE